MKEQGKVWPLLLPGVATIYNNSFHHTIEDVPFRLYRNREPSQLRHHIIPDDISWCYQAGDNETGDDDEEEEGDDDDDDDDLQDDDDLHGDGNEFFEGPLRSSNLSVDDLLQSCSNGSLNIDFLIQDQPKKPQSSEEPPSNPIINDDTDEFDVAYLPSCLYAIAKTSEWNEYHALESTEYTIHKNFKRSISSARKSSFKVGQKVLFRNPDLKNKKFSTFTFHKLNLVGVITEVCRGENYLVKADEGNHEVRVVFKGEMVPLNDGDVDDQASNNSTARMDFPKVLDLVTEIAAKTRETIYNNKASFRCKKKVDAGPLMARYN